MFHCNNPWIKNLTTYLPEQWHYKWAYWVRLPWPLLLVRPRRTRHCCCSTHCMHQLHRCSPNWGTSSIQCILASLPLHHCVWRREVGRGIRLMMVLTEYLSSGWRVMRHLSNLNIFHWAVMALSPGPHVCVWVRLHFRASERSIWMLIISVWVVCENACACQGIRVLSYQPATINACTIYPGKTALW